MLSIGGQLFLACAFLSKAQTGDFGTELKNYMYVLRKSTQMLSTFHKVGLLQYSLSKEKTPISNKLAKIV